MPNPKRKHTPCRRDTRRSANSKLTAPNPGKCSNCGLMKMPHRICPECGFYDGQLIIPKKVKKKDEQKEESK
ncbi:MAG: 50S ribosomal protein L32 [Elusimicrobiota bacterium]|jgi:large subunit ribosomal protein L32|nr:50S ribosomal protein L32 [Elusimicrobiota bacterium]